MALRRRGNSHRTKKTETKSGAISISSFRSCGSSAPGGHRKPRQRHGRSPSPAFSVGGTYKFIPRGIQRKETYRNKIIQCIQWTKYRRCSWGDACKFSHNFPVAPHGTDLRKSGNRVGAAAELIREQQIDSFATHMEHNSTANGDVDARGCL